MSRTPRRQVAPIDWLDADQQWAWRQLLSLMMTLPPALDGDLQRTTGLTMFEYTVLANLSEADEVTLPASELATRAVASLSRLSHVVSRLALRGLVAKRTCSTDARVSEVVLTKAGSAKVLEAAPRHVAKVRELVISPLTTAQLSRLGRAAAAISDQVAEASAETRD